MPGSSALPVMYSNIFTPVKGFDWINGLTKTAAIADRTDTHLTYGRVGYLNSAGAIVRGLADNTVPLFLYRDISSGDVTGTVGQDLDEVISGVVGLAGYEWRTTSYTVGGTYNPNTMLTAVDTEGAVADRGLLKVGTLGTDTIVGMVSSVGLQASIDGLSVLQFWTVYFPVYPHA